MSPGCTFLRSDSDGRTFLDVDRTVYTDVAIFRVCYQFTGRCYLYLVPSGTDSMRVYIESKDGGIGLDDLGNEFCNELINQRVREDVSRETAAIREIIVAHAFAEGNLLDAPLTPGDVADDPRGISRPDAV